MPTFDMPPQQGEASFWVTRTVFALCIHLFGFVGCGVAIRLCLQDVYLFTFLGFYYYYFLWLFIHASIFRYKLFSSDPCNGEV